MMPPQSTILFGVFLPLGFHDPLVDTFTPLFGELPRYVCNGVPEGLEVVFEELNIDRDDEVIAGCLLTHQGEVVHEQTASALNA